MPRNGSGDYSLPTNSWNPAINGVSATPADWQALIDDVKAAIQGSVASDGQTPMTGNLAMGGYRLTGAGAPSGAGMSLRWEQWIQGADIPSASSITIPLEGNLFAVTGSTAITSLAASVAGRLVFLKFDAGIVLTNSASLILPNGANITTYANQVLAFVADSSGWRLAGGAGILALVPGQNVLINSGFDINQDVLTGTVTLAAGAYGHDMFKAGSAGCAYTFSASGGKTTLNISSGSLMQVIEGAQLDSGTYCASWEGTAQCRIDGGTYAASAMTGTAVAGTNQTLEWGIGTLARPKYEQGSIATPWLPYAGIYGGENTAVLRYYERSINDGVREIAATSLGAAACLSIGTTTGAATMNPTFKVRKAFSPTIKVISPFNAAVGYMFDASASANRSVDVLFIGQAGFAMRNNVATSAGATHSANWTATARL